MEIDVNGTRLWFDVDGPALVADGPGMRERPTVVLVHGGPGSYDHSYFKPYFGRLTRSAQVVYLDLRGHGRSARTAVDEWTFEACADDVRALCDALGIARPIVFGHSMGGFIAMLYGARHPGHAGGLILQSTMARFDLDRLSDGFRRFGGDEIAELARRDYAGEPIADAEWDRVFATFGPRVPDPEQLTRRIRTVELGRRGMDLMRRFDVVGELRRIECPTLVCVGELDPVTPVDAAREIFAGLAAGVGQLEIVEQVGHFPWLDDPDRFWPVIEALVLAQTSRT